jgi:hypothetical protein
MASGRSQSPQAFSREGSFEETEDDHEINGDNQGAPYDSRLRNMNGDLADGDQDEDLFGDEDGEEPHVKP